MQLLPRAIHPPRQIPVHWRWLSIAEAAFSRQVPRSATPLYPLQGGSKVKSAALVGGTVIGLSGGAVAPAVASALLASLAASGVGAGGVGAVLTGAGGVGAVLGGAFGAAGAGIVGSKYARRTGEVNELALDILDSSPELALTLTPCSCSPPCSVNELALDLVDSSPGLAVTIGVAG
ncbi:hypothetical protein T484DRAFT_1856107 [Baffinella frigidus]|nr:hypothetical protein T484DRAFT_1856107 [Cryptophyta sp. CCMP2293]